MSAAPPQAAGTPQSLAPWSNEPKRPGPIATAMEVWQYRRFVNFLGAKSFRKLYARTILGWTWVLVAPLFPILMNLLIFGVLIGMTSEGIPYFLFLMVGNLAWEFFASALMWSTRGLEMHRKVIDQVYVPRVILPIATMTPAVFTFLLNVTVTMFVVIYYWVTDGTPYVSIGVNTLWSVASLLLIVSLVLGIGMFTSVWGETARDARFTMGNVVLIWFLMTPVLYPTSQVPVEYQKWLVLNPMASFVEAFKYGFFGTNPPDPLRFAIAAAIAVGLLAAGLMFFAWRSEIEETVVA
jgi:lipopolysaccharide transport system permease protein